MENNAKEQAQQIVDKIKELLKDGSGSRVLLKRGGDTLLNVSVNTGVLGALAGLYAAPFAVLTAALVSFGLDCEIEIEKKDGSVIRLKDTEKLETAKETVKNTARSIFHTEQTYDDVTYDSDFYEGTSEGGYGTPEE